MMKNGNFSDGTNPGPDPASIDLIQEMLNNYSIITV